MTGAEWLSVPTPPRQKWCGQEQPHDPHQWVDGHWWASCAGHTGHEDLDELKAVRRNSKGATS